MRPPIERLHASIGEVYEFLAYAMGVDGYRKSGGFSDAISSKGPEIAKYLASPSWRRHAYAFAIVNTYGAHERFMRDLVEGAAGVYAMSYQTYGQMPEDLRSAHLQFSVGHAREILGGRTNAGEDIKSVISNLAACLAGSTNLNRTALSSSNANFRVSVICDVLLRIGLKISTDEADRELQEIIRTDLNGLYGSTSAVIDDLANRRNEVAHGNDYEIMDIGTLVSVLKAVYAFDCWIYCQVAQHLLNRLVVDQGTKLGSITKTYTNATTGQRSVASVASVSATVSRGAVVYVRGREVARVVVHSLEKERVSVDAVAASDSGPFGMDLGIIIHPNNTLHALPAHLAAVAESLVTGLNEKPCVWQV